MTSGASGTRGRSGTPGADVTVIVLAGGTSRRFGGDKLAAPLRGSTVLDTLLASLPAEWPVVAVGPPRGCARPVTWTREEPPGGGPLAGVAAGVDLVRTDLVAVVAGDMPDAGAALVRLVAALLQAEGEVAAVVATDGAGVTNPLLGAYRTALLRAGLPASVHGLPARRLLTLAHTELSLPAAAVRDVDTRGDLEGLADPG